MNLISIITSSINNLKHCQDARNTSKSTEATLTPPKLTNLRRSVKTTRGPWRLYVCVPIPLSPICSSSPSPLSSSRDHQMGQRSSAPRKAGSASSPSARTGNRSGPRRLPSPAKRHPGCRKLYLKTKQNKTSTKITQPNQTKEKNSKLPLSCKCYKF